MLGVYLDLPDSSGPLLGGGPRIVPPGAPASIVTDYANDTPRLGTVTAIGYVTPSPTWSFAGSISLLRDNNTAAGGWFLNTTEEYGGGLKFDLGAPYKVDALKIHQNAALGNGTWRMYASDTSYAKGDDVIAGADDLGTFTWIGDGTASIEHALTIGAASTYRYYYALLESGVFHPSSPVVREVTFKAGI